MDRRTLLKAGGALALAGAVPGVQAQSDKTAFVISGFPVGGMGDHVARPIAEALRGKYANNVVVESKPGAGGRIAIDFVKRAPADGMTILQIPSSPMTLYPNTYRKLTYDSLNDFTPVTSTVSYCFVLTAGPGVPAHVKTLADYIAWVKANPRSAQYGVPAAGSALHFVGMMMEKGVGMPFTAVPYKGGAPLLNDVLGGQVPVSVSVLGEVMQHIRSGRLRGLAVSSGQRSPFLPEVPTFAEQGYPDIVVQEWLGWFVPAKTPADTVQRLNTLVREALQNPTLVKTLADNGLIPYTQSTQDFAKTVRGELDRWAPIVRASGFTAEE